MRREDIKEGMKVVPHNKTAGSSFLKDSVNWNVALSEDQHFLYVVNSSHPKECEVYLLSKDPGSYGGGDYFRASDFSEYIEPVVTDSKIDLIAEMDIIKNSIKSEFNTNLKLLQTKFDEDMKIIENLKDLIIFRRRND